MPRKWKQRHFLKIAINHILNLSYVEWYWEDVNMVAPWLLMTWHHKEPRQKQPCCWRYCHWKLWSQSLIIRFMGPTWGPSGANRTQVGPMSAPWTLLSGIPKNLRTKFSVSKLEQGVQSNLSYIFVFIIMNSITSYFSNKIVSIHMKFETRHLLHYINTLRLRQNGCYFADKSFNCIFLMKTFEF